jgi:hypothetical protein
MNIKMAVAQSVYFACGLRATEFICNEHSGSIILAFLD